jgi:uncharacterized membrane protein (UPF0182 family)
MKRYRIPLLALLVAAIGILLSEGAGFYVDALWFNSVGYYTVFRSIVWAKFLFWTLGFLASFVVLSLNYWLTSRRVYEHSIWSAKEYLVIGSDEKKRLVFRSGILIISALLGFVAQSEWLTFLQYQHQVRGGTLDPIFGRTLSFYFFDLPLWSFLVNFSLGLVIVAFVVSAISYVLHGHLAYTRQLQLTYSARLHLAVLVGVGFCLIAARLWLKRYLLLFSTHEQGVTFGASYSDIHAWLPIYWILTALVLVVAVLFFVSPAVGSLRYSLLGLAGVIVVYLVGGLYPSLIQMFRVEPNEFEKERPYIRHHIRATLDAFNLDGIVTRDFSSGGRLDAAAMARNAPTLGNIRLWDWRPLKDAYGQLQSIRPYYGFEDVDIDRYTVEGDYRQIMLSARELNFANISGQAQTWINQYFQYTHGYGLCASPVNEVTSEGLPEFFVQDIPPRSSVGLNITRPEIYFGEKTDYPVFVKTRMKEFDYPIGEQNAETTYRANRGLPIGSFLRRLVFAWELGSFQILFTENFTRDSRVLLYRMIGERVRKIAPFLEYDQDPYIVIDEGRLFWIQDAYTTSGRYPYSQPFNRQFNYIRNSVKVVVDAYLGDVSFYISDPSDALIRCYARVFPGLFKPLSAMRPGLRPHLRYPEDLFDVQRFMYCTYHMRDPRVFYNQEDVWEIPNEIYGGEVQPMESYYTIMSLPREKKEEFILLSPLTPKNKNNMIAWLAARSDGSHYGKLVLYQFPKQQLTYGPMQIEARIDQDPSISQLITLWSQKGSRVIRGNLLVIPIENSLLYIEPMYLQAEKSEIPELTRVVVVYGNRVALGQTLREALKAAIEGVPGQPLTPLPPPAALEAGFTMSPEAQALVQEALRMFELSQERLKEGDWSGYGEAQQALSDLLDQLAAGATKPSEKPPR